MFIKALVLLCGVSLTQACSISSINFIWNLLMNLPTTPPPPTTTTTTKPSSPPCKCGIPNKTSRIVNGTVTEAHEYPWMVGLTRNYTGYPFCGGSIISDRLILTSARCVSAYQYQPSDIKVLVGGWDASNSTNTMWSSVCKVTIHPDYYIASSSQHFDVAVLTVCGPMPTYLERVGPVCLPQQGVGTQYEGQYHTVTGWGLTSAGGVGSGYLMKADVKTMPNSMCCNQDYNYGYGWNCNQITDDVMCAISVPAGAGVCGGDQGGPLVYNQVGNYVQTGIVSWAAPCGNSDPDTYARVSKVVDWIKSVDQASGNKTVCSI